MAQHNYKQENVSQISADMQTSKSTLESIPLAIESMPYSWNTGVINTVVQWFEVLTILRSRDELIRLFEKGERGLTFTSELVSEIDSQATANLDSSLISLQTMISDIGQVTSELATMATVTESHSWIPETEAVIYNISEYIGFDSDKKTYYIKDKDKIRNLINQEKPDVATQARITKIFTLTVDENGSINTGLLQELLECSYTKEITHESFPQMHTTFIPDPNMGYVINTIYTNVEYALYKKADTVVTVSNILQDPKYGNLQRILIGAPECLESKHFDSYDNIINFSDLKISIQKQNMQNQYGFINDLDYYIVYYEATNNDTAKKSTYNVLSGSYMCFDHIDTQAAYKDAFYFLAEHSTNNLQGEIKKYLENGKLEDLNFAVETGKFTWETIKFGISVLPGSELFDGVDPTTKVEKVIDKSLDVAGTSFDSKDYIDAFIEYATFNERQKQIEAYNAEIDKTVFEMCGDYTSTIKYTYSYLLLNGYSSSDIIVSMNEYGLVTNIDVTHNAVANPNFSFYDEWNKFLAYCKNNNFYIYEKYKDIVVTDFDSLRDIEDGEVIQRRMAHYYYTHNGL